MDISGLLVVTSLFSGLSAHVVKRQVGTGFNQAQIVGTVKSSHISEASGLAASRRHPGYLYTHNDHGHGANIHVLSGDGHRVATLHVTGATSHDWEDIAVGPCSSSSSNTCIYIADTGDSGNGAENALYKVIEPASMTSQDLPIEAKLSFSWNQPDRETLLVDSNAEVFIISKAKDGAGVIAHLPAQAWGSGSRVHVSSTAIVGITSTAFGPVAGDISPRGDEVLIKTKHAMFYWSLNNSRDYLSVLQTPGMQVPYTNEPQGEAVCWDSQARGYYTLSEGDNQPLFYYQKSA